MKLPVMCLYVLQRLEHEPGRSLLVHAFLFVLCAEGYFMPQDSSEQKMTKGFAFVEYQTAKVGIFIS